MKIDFVYNGRVYQLSPMQVITARERLERAAELGRELKTARLLPSNGTNQFSRWIGTTPTKKQLAEITKTDDRPLVWVA